jgi:hypothetical protein
MPKMLSSFPTASMFSSLQSPASSLVDSLVLYDPKEIFEKAKSEFKPYPEEMRTENVRNFHEWMVGFSEAVWYHYVKKTCEDKSIFSKLYAMEALRILFPINRVYLQTDKRIFEQLKELPNKRHGYAEKCLALLRFKSQDLIH